MYSAVSSAHVFQSWGKRRSVAGAAAEIARTRPASGWKRLSAGTGTKGPRLHDWCYLELADLEVEEFSSANQGLWTRGLLIRRHIADGDLAFFTTWCPAATSIETLVAVEGYRWAIEDSFETAKNEFGLDHNESRSWHGWHRHVSLVMLGFTMMAAIRHHANPPPPKKTQRRTTANTKAPPRLHRSLGQSRKFAASPSDSPESGSNPHTSSHGHFGVELTRRSLSARTSKQKGNCNAKQGRLVSSRLVFLFARRRPRRRHRRPEPAFAKTESATAASRRRPDKG